MCGVNTDELRIERRNQYNHRILGISVVCRRSALFIEDVVGKADVDFGRGGCVFIWFGGEKLFGGVFGGVYQWVADFAVACDGLRS